jgi:cell division protein FtsA
VSRLAGMRGGRRPATGKITAVLDIGSHKVCCLIASLELVYAANGATSTRPRLIGLGHQRSQGIVSGAVVDLRLAQSAVAAAVSQAEQAAGVRVEQVLLAVSCGNPRSRTFDGHVDLPGGIVTEADIDRLDAGAMAFAARDGALLTLNRIAYSLDQTPSVREPCGLAGQRLDANHHAVTVESGPLRNLCLLVESCQLEIAGLLPAAYASALAATTEAERQAGVVCVDIGAGLASIAGFADGHFIFDAALPLAGQQVTHELAHAGALSVAQAERIKTLYGTLAPSPLDEHEFVPLADVDDGNGGHTALTRAEVGRIVAAEAGRLLARITAVIHGCPVPRIRNAGIVLTGGASELSGFESFAAASIDRPVRVSAPPRLEGAAGRLSGGVPSPAFACAVGLVLAAAMPAPWIVARDDRQVARRGYLGRVEQWLRESF